MSLNSTSINATVAISSDTSESYPLPLSEQITYIAIILGSTVASVFFHIALTYILRRLAKRTVWKFDDDLVDHCSLSTRVMFPVIVLLVTLPLLRIPSNVQDPIEHTLIILLILTFIWFFLNIVKCLYLLLYRANTSNKNLARHPGDKFNVHQRTVETQLIVMQRLADFVIWIIGIAAILLTFPNVWELGISFLASAGIGAIIVGLAAKPVLENLLGSVTIAFTNPIILDDTVVVDNEQGVIEEITFQYVVVRTSDDRRVIIPLMRFLSGSFENWSRGGTQMSMSFNMFTDYLVPLADIRKEFTKLAGEEPDWDGRVATVSISDCTQSCIQITFTISASNPNSASTLVTNLREKIVNYIVLNHPQCLPRQRSAVLELSHASLAQTSSGLATVVARMEDPLLGKNVGSSN